MSAQTATHPEVSSNTTPEPHSTNGHEVDPSVQILSDIVTYTKYARYLPDKKRRETFDEIVERNKEMHKEKFPDIADDIDRAYEFVHHKKVLPSMRSMQFAGRPIEINPVRIYNCFRETTEFVTSEGVKSFEDFEDGEETVVLTHTGSWKKALVRNYGSQTLNKITIKRGRNETIHYATGNHRWLLSDGSETTSLKEGDYLLPAPDFFQKFEYDEATPFERLYWAYGYVYGDGTAVKNRKGGHTYSMVRLCNKDKERFAYRFEELGFTSSQPLSCGGDPVFYTGKYTKTPPDPSVDSPEMIRAFIAGYLDADGGKNNDDTMLSKFRGITAADKDHQAVIETLFPVAGVFISSSRETGARTGGVTNLGKRNPDAKEYTLFDKVSGKTNATFRVKSIETFREEEVWCLEVEGDASFVLASGISTGNCAYQPVDHPDALSETMYLLLSGTGVGYSVQKQHVKKLPPVLGCVHPEGKQQKKRYLVGDSIEGWADAVKVLVESYFYGKREVDFDFRDIRPKGAKLITSGGKAPGPEPLREALVKIQSIFEQAIAERGRGTYLKPIEVHDIQCHIADAVLAGGIRRAAMISLFSFNDEEMLASKIGNWWENNPQRGRANNSAVAVRTKIKKKDFEKFWTIVEESKSGEPGIFFTSDRDGNWGLNPCAEVSLRPHQFCNLTTINAADIKDQEDLNNRAWAASFIGTLQASYTDFHYLRDVWQDTTEKEALLGVSMTGIGSGRVMQDDIDLEEAAEVVKQTNSEVAKEIGIREAARTTVVKPEGTSSLLLGTSSGVHGWWDPYYIRTMRIGKNESLYSYIKRRVPKLMEDEIFRPTSIGVLNVPQAAPKGAIYREESPLDTLERVKKFSREWIRNGHRDGLNYNNVSCTINVKDDEWGDVGEWMWENRDYYTAIAVLPYDGGTYSQSPFQTIDKKTFDEMYAYLKHVDLTKVKEEEDLTDLQGELACAGDACEITSTTGKD